MAAGRREPDSGKVAITFPVRGDGRERISARFAGAAEVTFLAELDDNDRLGALQQADALLVWGWRRELREDERLTAGRVPFIQLITAGADSLPFDDVSDDTVVASNVGAYAEPMAEHVLAMALALAKRLPQEHSELARGQWNFMSFTRSVRGLTAGILGFGGIGKATARLLRPLGVAIHAVNTSGRTDEPVDFIGTLADLDHVLAVADMVVVALPLSLETRGLIGARELELMKPDAILVNVARGALIDQAALYEHLETHPSFGAGIDSWWTEPFDQGVFALEHPFFDLPNVLGSPHNSALVPGIIEQATDLAVENLLRWVRGDQVRGIVPREDYDPDP